MDFNKVEQIVSNRLAEPEDTEKQAEKLAKKTVEAEKNQKPPKKDTLLDMQKLANAKNLVSAMTKKVEQQENEKKPTKKVSRTKGKKGKK